MKPQAQAPQNNPRNLTNDTASKIARDISNDIGNSDHNNGRNNYPRNLELGISDNGKPVYNPGENIFNTEDDLIHDAAANTTATTSNVSCAANTHHTFNRDCDKTILTASNIVLPASDVVLHSRSLRLDNDSSTQHHHPRHNCRLPARFRTDEYVPTTASHTPSRSRLLASELTHAN